MEEIANRVKDSGLISLDLAAHKPKMNIVGIDLADQLWQGLVLKEKDFRAWIKETDWDHYKNSAVYIFCSADAIIPTWAYMLVTSSLLGNSAFSIVGSKEDLEKALIHESIFSMDKEQFKDGKIIIKGCSDITCPEYAMAEMIRFLQPLAKSIMYGEPCSTVPVFKRK